MAVVTVVVQSSVPQGTYVTITNDKGFYEIADLQPATYSVGFYYGEVYVETAVAVKAGIRTTIDREIEQPTVERDVIEVKPVPLPLAPANPTIVPLHQSFR